MSIVVFIQLTDMYLVVYIVPIVSCGKVVKCMVTGCTAWLIIVGYTIHRTHQRYIYLSEAGHYTIVTTKGYYRYPAWRCEVVCPISYIPLRTILYFSGSCQAKF